MSLLNLFTRGALMSRETRVRSRSGAASWFGHELPLAISLLKEGQLIAKSTLVDFHPVRVEIADHLIKEARGDLNQPVIIDLGLSPAGAERYCRLLAQVVRFAFIGDDSE